MSRAGATSVADSVDVPQSAVESGGPDRPGQTDAPAGRPAALRDSLLLDRLPRRPAREAVVGQLLELLRNGTIKPGDRLPPEPELMRLTGMGRSTIREAVRSLASMHLVEVRHGHGTFVRSGLGKLLDDPYMVLFLADRQVLDDLVEARRVIEPAIAQIAAARATREDVAALGGALRELATITMVDATETPWREAHLTFHAALAHATHNVVLTRMWASVATFLRDSPLIAPGPPGSWETVGRAIHEHLYRAVAARDPAQAATAMQAHIDDMVAFLDGAPAPGGQAAADRGTSGDGRPQPRPGQPREREHGAAASRRPLGTPGKGTMQ